MSIEAMKQAYQILITEPHSPTACDKLEAILRQAIAEAENQDGDCQRCNGKGCVACDAREQEPVAWATREDFYRELDRSVNRMRQQMEIKKVLMRCADYDIALPVIDIREGCVLVGQVTTPPQRSESSGKPAAWVGLTDEEISELIRATHNTGSFVRAIEAKLKEKNT